MKFKNILLVEDTSSLLKLGKAILESDGYRVYTATDGLEALSSLSQNKIDLILTDILMPNMDGYMLCYMVRSQPNYNNIPIIIYSATYTSMIDEALSIQIGADTFLRKPAAIPVLLAAVRNLLMHPRKEQDITSLKESPNIMLQYSSQLVNKLTERNNEITIAKDGLEASEKKFRVLIEKGMDLITLLSPEGNLIYVSPSISSVLGYNSMELLDTSIYDLIHEGDLTGLLKQIKTIQEKPGDFFFTKKRILHKNGRWIWCEGTIVNMLNENGIHALVSNLRNITEQRNAEIELAHANESLSFHIENAPLGFIEWDNQLRVNSWSKRVEEIFGWTLNEFVELEKTGYTPIYIEDQPLAFNLVKELIAGNVERSKVQLRSYTKGGNVIWCEWFNSVLRNKEGEVITIMSLVQDITERKVAEEKLINHVNILHEVASMQSHQVRAPIANILGLISLFKFDNPEHPLNAEILVRLETATKLFDKVIYDIVKKTGEIEML